MNQSQNPKRDPKAAIPPNRPREYPAFMRVYVQDEPAAYKYKTCPPQALGTEWIRGALRQRKVACQEQWPSLKG